MQIERLATIGNLLHAMRAVKSVWVTGNPAYLVDTPKARIALMRHTERSQWRGFQLTLNDAAVSVQEQVDGLQLALATRRNPALDAESFDVSMVAPEEHEFLYRMYLALVLDNMGVTGLESSLSLSHCNLQYFGDLVSVCKVRSLAAPTLMLSMAHAGMVVPVVP